MVAQPEFEQKRFTRRHRGKPDGPCVSRDLLNGGCRGVPWACEGGEGYCSAGISREGGSVVWPLPPRRLANFLDLEISSQIEKVPRYRHWIRKPGHLEKAI